VPGVPGVPGGGVQRGGQERNKATPVTHLADGDHFDLTQQEQVYVLQQLWFTHPSPLFRRVVLRVARCGQPVRSRRCLLLEEEEGGGGGV
jgi:hypothetical protein